MAKSCLDLLELLRKRGLEGDELPQDAVGVIIDARVLSRSVPSTVSAARIALPVAAAIALGPGIPKWLP